MILMKTNKGDILIELNHEKAPISAKNFEDYVKDGHYTNTIFHRVIKGFMIQGGGFTPEFEHKDTRAPIENEADNGLKNEVGTVALARTNDPHSATTQFFINTVDNDFLNFKSKTMSGWGYCVFGKVVKGMDVVFEIEKSKTETRGMYRDVPVEDVVILSCEIVDDNQDIADKKEDKE